MAPDWRRREGLDRSRRAGSDRSRRAFLAGLSATAVGGLAGCGGLLGGGDDGGAAGTPRLVEDRPDAVYLPTHVDEMEMAGMASDGPYRCALTYTSPHYFWTVTGTRSTMVTPGDDAAVHLMPIVWHEPTGIVPPDRNPTMRIEPAAGAGSGEEGGENTTSWSSQVSPWSMLSQSMGFHFGDNVALPAAGAYRVTVSPGDPTLPRTGELADAPTDLSFAFDLSYDPSAVEAIPIRDVPAYREGIESAVDPMSMDAMPSTQLPAPVDLPGTVRGQADTGDATLVVTTFEGASRFAGASDAAYLAVSARTPHNRYVLPQCSLSATLVRDGERVAEGPLQATIDPELGYHYGTTVPSVAAGDELTLVVDAPSQVARHEGYETAFLQMPDRTLTLA